MASNNFFGSEMAEDDILVESRMGNMSNGNETSSSKLFDKPQRLIFTDEEGLLQFNSDVLNQISQINMKINVVGVCGMYRTGKSYLMNWIAGEKTGFNLGDTIQSETKGIWIWCREHPKKSDQALVLLDTEGSDDPGKGDSGHDNKMFCLTLLLSSTLILNIKSVFDCSTLDKLAFIASLSDMIKVVDDNAEDKHNSKTIQIASPTLVMCIRDFFLQITKNGKDQTANEYFEDNLTLVEVSTSSAKAVQETQQKFNNIKKHIKDYFPKRTCFTIAQPAMGENLHKIEELDETSLEKRFIDDIRAFQSYVYDRKPKYIYNASKKPLDGADLSALIKCYVKSLRQGSPLNCQDAYGQASFQRNERAFNQVLTKFKRDMDTYQHIENKEKLQSLFLSLFDDANAKYRENSFLYHQNENEERLLTEMQAYLDMMKKKINETCMEKGTEELSKMYDDMFKKNQTRYIMDGTGYSNYEADMEQLKKDFFEKKKLYDKDVLYQCFDAFMHSKSDDKTAMYCKATEQKNKEQIDKIQKEISERMEDQLKKALAEEKKKRNRYIDKAVAELKAKNKELQETLSKRLCSIM